MDRLFLGKKRNIVDDCDVLTVASLGGKNKLRYLCSFVLEQSCPIGFFIFPPPPIPLVVRIGIAALSFQSSVWLRRERVFASVAVGFCYNPDFIGKLQMHGGSCYISHMNFYQSE
jgi:hypothetical protein